MAQQLLSKLEVQNFGCFRKKTIFPLAKGTYLVGANNSGKSIALNAIRFFFDDTLYKDESFLNKTEFLGRAKGYNKSIITIVFSLDSLNTKKFKQQLIDSYGGNLSITKEITITEITKTISASYKISGKTFAWITLPQDVRKLIESVKLTYLHPQEGKELLDNAKEKLRKRLLANWGRGWHSDITKGLKALQDDWEKLSANATRYLSSALTTNLKKMWPTSETTIELPKNIRDIIAISDINFRGSKGNPDIQLTSQGTGAQSTILYLTHYILDSDRSLQRGEYHPVWLLEEPESFLHSDLMVKLGKELNSASWIENIQMIISTHSPEILACSNLRKEEIIWNLIDNHSLKKSAFVCKWEEHEIKDIGKLMGDSNFYAYFVAAEDKPLIFSEDSKEATSSILKECGIDIAKGLSGITEVSKYIDVFKTNEFLVSRGAYFIVDADKGKKEIEKYIQTSELENEFGGFKRLRIKDTKNIYLILLPEGDAVEDLFSEFQAHLDECILKIWDPSTWDLLSTIPSKLTRTGASIKDKKPKSIEDAKLMIKNIQEVKDLFWAKIKKNSLKVDSAHATSIKKLIAE